MSYLEALMSTEVPSDEKSMFRKCTDDDQTNVVHEKTDEKSTDEKSTERKSKPYVNKNKNSLRENNNSKPKDPNYKSAIEKAQSDFVSECIPDGNTIASIKQSMQFVKNWEGHYINVDVTDDIILTLDEKEYSFSRKQFIANKYFQKSVIEEFSNFLDGVFIKFFRSKNENIWKIHIKKSYTN